MFIGKSDIVHKRTREDFLAIQVPVIYSNPFKG